MRPDIFRIAVINEFYTYKVGPNDWNEYGNPEIEVNYVAREKKKAEYHFYWQIDWKSWYGSGHIILEELTEDKIKLVVDMIKESKKVF